MNQQSEFMKKNWQIKDLIDLEFFLSNIKEDEPVEKELSDRKIFLDHIEPILKKEKPSGAPEKTIVRYWLEQKRKIYKQGTDAGNVLPGEIFDDVYRVFAYSFGFIGAFIGVVLAFSILTYRGDSPINVSIYLGVFVILQVILFLIFFIGLVCRRLFRFLPQTPVLYHLLNMSMSGLIKKIKLKTSTAFFAENRNVTRAISGLLKEKKNVYGSVFYWPFFIVAQIFGIGFNAGVLSATFFRILGSDLAFGWQSTVRFSPEAVLKMVALLANPWRWLMSSDSAHPSLEQIEGSRIVLKDGIYQLATSDLIAWWPFLCLCVLFYGLLPRMILLIFGYVFQFRSLRKMDFHHRQCDQLIRRLLTPVVSTSGFYQGNSQSRENHFTSPPGTSEYTPDLLSQEPIKLIPLIHKDIFDWCEDSELEKITRKIGGTQYKHKIKITGDFDEDKLQFNIMSEDLGKYTSFRVLLIQEAWQPPIKEILLFLSELRSYVGKKKIIHVGLIGKPSSETIFTKVEDRDYIIWEQELTPIGDPYIILERLVEYD